MKCEGRERERGPNRTIGDDLATTQTLIDWNEHKHKFYMLNPMAKFITIVHKTANQTKCHVLHVQFNNLLIFQINIASMHVFGCNQIHLNA